MNEPAIPLRELPPRNRRAQRLKRASAMGCGAIVAGFALLCLVSRVAEWTLPKPAPAAPLPVPNAFDDFKSAGQLAWQLDEAWRAEKHDDHGAEALHRRVAKNAEPLRLLRAGFAKEYFEPREHAVAPDAVRYELGWQTMASMLFHEVMDRSRDESRAAQIDCGIDEVCLGMALERGIDMKMMPDALSIQGLGACPRIRPAGIDKLAAM